MRYVAFRLDKAAAPPPPEPEPEPAPEPAPPPEPAAQASPPPAQARQPAQTRPAQASQPKAAPAAGEPAKPARTAPPAPEAPQAAQSPHYVPAEARDAVHQAGVRAMQQAGHLPAPYNAGVLFQHGGDMRTLTQHLAPEHAEAVHDQMHMARVGAGGLEHPNCRCTIIRSENGETPDQMQTAPDACQQCRDAAVRFNADAAQRAAGQDSRERPERPEREDAEPEEEGPEPAEAEEALELSTVSARPRRWLILGGRLPTADLFKSARRRKFRLRMPKAPRLPTLPTWPVAKPPKPASPDPFLRVDPTDPKHREFLRQLLTADAETKGRLRPAGRFIVLRWRR